MGVLGGGNLEAEGLGADNAEAAEIKDTIAEHMWKDYQNYLQDHQDEYEEERRRRRRSKSKWLKYRIQKQKKYNMMYK